MKLTVIIRDLSPMIHLQEPVSHRRVTFELTEEQEDLLKLKCTGSVGSANIFEEYSSCFIEGSNMEKAPEPEF